MEACLSRVRTQAFTLIELLVVITIIVVLLAMLAPALDKAIYEAEMAVDLAKLRSISVGSTTYAVGSNRNYPSRGWSVNAGSRPNLIYDPGTVSPGAPIIDDRTLFSQTISLDAFMDPFVEALELDETGPREDAYVYIPTNLYAGWKFASGRGMIKLGNRFTSKDYDTTDEIVTNTFDIIAADMDQIRADQLEIHSAHPDKTGKMILVTYYNTNLVNTVPAFVPAVPHVFSEWQGAGFDRGPADYNYAKADNSAFRVNDVEVRHNGNIAGDERMKAVSINHADIPDHLHMLPPVSSARQ